MRINAFYEGLTTDDQHIQIIANKVEEGAFDPAIRKLAISIVRKAGCKHKDFMCEIKAIYNWIKENVRYFYDQEGTDAYHSAYSIAFELKGGDCDDFAILAGALLGSIGYPIALRIIAKTKEGKFVHIYPLVGIPPHGKKLVWIPLEFTDPKIPFGKEFPHAKERTFRIFFDPKRVYKLVEQGFYSDRCRCGDRRNEA